jgi:hypothetical protein
VRYARAAWCWPSADPWLSYSTQADGVTRNRFFTLLAFTLLFRCWLAAALPITGDEAYFIWWGKIPDWGYYDHPPMIGWWLAGLMAISDAEWWLRLPAILLPGVMALATQRFLRVHGEELAWSVASLILLAPLHVWNVIITTDTPLVYFSFFSALAFLRAARDDHPGYYLLSGLLLSGAVLSKYFAALLGFAYLLHALVRPNRHKSTGLLLCYAAVIPALLLMAWWNAGHCWSNYMFNFVNRHEGAGLSLKTPLLYGVMMLYALTPPLLWAGWRQRWIFAELWQDAAGRALCLIAVAPLLLLGALSLVRQVGLHWVLAFLPFAYILMAGRIEAEGRQRLTRFFTGFAILHMLVFMIIAQVPLETWRRLPIYKGIVLTVEAPALLEQLRPYADDYVFASDGYSNAVTLGYNARRYVMVFGEASSHARHDDILTDYRSLAGRNILILRKTAPVAGEYEKFFAQVEYRSIRLRGAEFHLVLGRDFNYGRYRDDILARVRTLYYAIPRWLPQTGCYYCDRYFPETPCRQ